MRNSVSELAGKHQRVYPVQISAVSEVFELDPTASEMS